MKEEEAFEKALRAAQKAALFLAYAGAISLFGGLLAIALPDAGYGYSLSFGLSALFASFVDSPALSLLPSLLVSALAIFLSLMLAKMKKAAVFLAPAFVLIDTLALAFFPLFGYGVYGGSGGFPLSYLFAILAHLVFVFFLALFLALYAKLFRLNEKRTSHEQHH